MRVQMDVTLASSHRPGGRRGRRAFGRLDILVNNAGLGPENPAEDVTEADFDLDHGVNVKGVFFASQAAGRVMIRQGSAGSSTSARRPASSRCPTESVYCIRRPPFAHLTVPRGRMGAPRHHGQRGGPDVHPDRRHGGGARRPGVRGGRRASASPGCTGSASRWTCGRGRLPGVAGRVAGDRHDAAGRWRMDGALSDGRRHGRRGRPAARGRAAGHRAVALLLGRTGGGSVLRLVRATASSLAFIIR